MTDDIAIPVALLDRRLACANRVWNVHLDHIRDTNGAEVDDYITLGPKGERPDLISGVAVLPVVGEGFGLLRSYRHAVERWVWELPRGFVDEGEDPAESALRELEEESALRCARADLRPLGMSMTECSTIRGRVALFAALNCQAVGSPKTDEVGLGQLRIIPKPQVLDMLARFEIEESSTQVALYRFLAHGGGIT